MLKYIAIALTLLLALFISFSVFLKKDKTTVQNNQTIIIKKDNAFYTTAFINGMEKLAIIDTGASTVSMSEEMANELGLDYTTGIPVESETANGLVKGKAVILKSDMKLILIGMSFLGKLNIRMANDKMFLSQSI
jgi:predicted aspartyl protease